eukprot:TRINITY_DN4825_c0_g1_i1.p1 TRINITY_DN4825_c0_g1~~TRINITY_DN4825_c0_g1_i1.p1  ORF type:complete len:317 (+),score=80.67 TRINITY_DN4825_c0_g1_i1:75-1025(+)
MPSRKNRKRRDLKTPKVPDPMLTQHPDIEEYDEDYLMDYLKKNIKGINTLLAAVISGAYQFDGRKDVYDMILNVLVWLEVPFSQIQGSGDFEYLYPACAKFGVDIGEANLKQMLKDAYNYEVEAAKKHLSTKKVNLLVDYARKKANNYIGLSVVSEVYMPGDVVPTIRVNMLGMVHFEDKSPEAHVYLNQVTEKLREFDINLLGERLKSVNFCNQSKKPGDGAHILAQVRAHVLETLQPRTKSLASSYFGQGRAMVDERMQVGIKYIDSCRRKVIKATLCSDDSVMPELTKEIMFFRTNDIGDFIMLINGKLVGVF